MTAHGLFLFWMVVQRKEFLTIEGAGHLGTIMTQYSILYALSRRDSKYAFIPPEIEMPMKQAFLNISLQSISVINNCAIKFRVLPKNKSFIILAV